MGQTERAKKGPETVLMTTDTLGGVWQYTLELASALKACHGVTTVLATMGAPLGREHLNELKKIPDIDVYESDFKLEWMDDPWVNVELAGEWLLRLNAYIRPDIVHLNGYSHATLDWGAPVVVAAHSCVLSWWKAVKGVPAPDHFGPYRERVEEGLKAADLVVAPSFGMLETLMETYAFSSRRKVIYNSRDAAAFRPLPKEDMIVAAGRLWDEAKNIEAVSRVAERLPWRVYAAGPESHGGLKSRLSENITSLGRLSQVELAELLGRASIFVHPARYEPFGLTVLEAALSGCALVLGDVAVMRELWEGAALFVPPDDTAALDAAVTELISSASLRDELSRRAMALAASFTPERMAGSYFESYEELYGAHSAGMVSELFPEGEIV